MSDRSLRELLTEFDSLFMSDTLISKYRSLDERLQQRNLGVIDSGDLVNDLLGRDLVQYQKVIRSVSRSERTRSDYEQGIERYDAIVGIADRIRGEVPNFITELWSRAVSVDVVDRSLLQRIVDFYNDVNESGVNSDIDSWVSAVECEEETRQRIISVRDSYMQTDFESQSDAEQFFADQVQVIVDEQSQNLEGKYHTSHYPVFPDLDELVVLVRDEIDRYDELNQGITSMQAAIAEMEADIVYLEQHQLHQSKLSLVKTILKRVTREYSGVVETNHIKYNSIGDGYRETYLRFVETRDRIVRDGINGLEERIRTISLIDKPTQPNKTDAIYIRNALQDIENATGVSYNHELDAVVNEIEVYKEPDLVVVLPRVTKRQEPDRRTRGPEYKITRLDPQIPLPDSDVHPSYVAASLERIEIPLRYTAFHQAVLEGAKTAVKETGRLLQTNSIACPEPLTQLERGYLDTVNTLFRDNPYVNR